MDFSDGQIKDMLEIKERTLQKIEKYQKEIRILEKQLAVLDAIVKQSSFAKASSLPKSEGAKRPAEIQADQPAEIQADQPAEIQADQPAEKAIPITRGSQGGVIANAYVTPERISIVLDESCNVDEETPPFKSFFIDRIIGGMKRKDGADGAVPSDQIIDCEISMDGPNIREIVVKNYRQEERVNEIINTAGWSLSKMLDNTGRE